MSATPPPSYSAAAMDTVEPAMEEQAPVPHGRRLWGSVRRALSDIPFLLPVVALIGPLILAPTVIAVVHSFTQWNPGYPSPFIGFQNYSALLRSPVFWQILKNEGFLLLGVPFWIAIPLVLSFLLYEKVPFSGTFRAVFFFPATASPALIGILFTLILGPEGPLNAFLHNLGWHSPPDWLVDASLVKPILIAVVGWATVGTGIIIFSAGLSAIPVELFEVAEIDGAGWWQRLRFVALPGLRRLVELWAVILLVTVFVAMFPWVYTLTNGGPGYSSTTLDYDVYQNALNNGYFGLAAAEMVVMLLLVGIVLVVGWAVLSRTGGADLDD